MENSIIEISGLCKAYGEVQAVRDLTFSVREGELFAFLGENGAGKSTTINIICTALAKDSGRVCVCGADIDREKERVRKTIGVVYQGSRLDGPLSVWDNLESRAALYGITGAAFRRRLEVLSERLEFRDILRRPLRRLSGGQRRRIDIARALLHQPRLLILDEPTTGLDPQTRKLLWQVVEELRREEGLTVFLTTHYMEEAADADSVIILDHGKIAAEGSPLELKNDWTGDHITLYGVGAEELSALGLPAEPLRDAFRITVPNTAEATKLILAHPEIFRDYEITKGCMDDVFLNVTGRRMEGGEAK